MGKMALTGTITLVILAILAISITMIVKNEQVDIVSDVILDTDMEPGAINYNMVVEELSWFDNFRLRLKDIGGFTTIDDAVCNIHPDYEADWIVTETSDLCIKNNNYIGMAYQLFDQTEPGQWDYIGEKQISNGEQKCFRVDAGSYYYVYYICDKLAERECSETDDGIDYETKGSTTFIIEDKKTVETDVCLSSVRLQEIYCDADDSIQSRLKTCEYGCLNGACKEKPVETCKFKEEYYCKGDNLMKLITYTDCTTREKIDDECKYGCEDDRCLNRPTTCESSVSYYCADNTIVKTIIYEDCTEDDRFFKECSESETCEDGKCVLIEEEEPIEEEEELIEEDDEPVEEEEEETGLIWYQDIWDWIKNLFI